jgi:hypothetical protein
VENAKQDLREAKAELSQEQKDSVADYLSFKKVIEERIAEGKTTIKERQITNKKERLTYLQNQEKLVSNEVVSKMRAEYRSRNADGYLRPGMDQGVVAEFVYPSFFKLNTLQFNSCLH